MKPKEGTILTVAKGISDKAAEVASQTDRFGRSNRYNYKSCRICTYQRHLRCLPVLKEAGVVDSGGQGLVVVLRGML